MARSSLEILVDSPLTTVATFEQTAITVVHTELTMESLRVARTVNGKICAGYPEGAVALTIVQPNIRLPDAELRRAASEAMAATRSRTRAVARVFLGDGFWLSSVRSVLTAIELLRPYDLPKRTFGELSVATHWLSQLIHADATWAQRLNEVVGELARPASDERAGAST
jgi:hypothetical protein